MGALAARVGLERGHVFVRRRRRRAVDEGRAAAAAQYLEGVFRDLAAHGVEHGVAVLHHLGEIFLVVINHLVGAEAFHIVDVGRTAGGDHPRAQVFGQLQPEARHTARPALHQHGLAGLDLECVFDRDNGG